MHSGVSWHLTKLLPEVVMGFKQVGSHHSPDIRIWTEVKKVSAKIEKKNPQFQVFAKIILFVSLQSFDLLQDKNGYKYEQHT